jgi:hypothetical protein
MGPLPFATIMAEQIIAYVRYGLEMRDARVLAVA